MVPFLKTAFLILVLLGVLFSGSGVETKCSFFDNASAEKYCKMDEQYTPGSNKLFVQKMSRMSVEEFVKDYNEDVSVVDKQGVNRFFFLNGVDVEIKNPLVIRKGENIYTASEGSIWVEKYVELDKDWYYVSDKDCSDRKKLLRHSTSILNFVNSKKVSKGRRFSYNLKGSEKVRFKSVLKVKGIILHEGRGKSLSGRCFTKESNEEKVSFQVKDSKTFEIALPSNKSFNISRSDENLVLSIERDSNLAGLNLKSANSNLVLERSEESINYSGRGLMHIRYSSDWDLSKENISIVSRKRIYGNEIIRFFESQASDCRISLKTFSGVYSNFSCRDKIRKNYFLDISKGEYFWKDDERFLNFSVETGISKGSSLNYSFNEVSVSRTIEDDIMYFSVPVNESGFLKVSVGDGMVLVSDSLYVSKNPAFVLVSGLISVLGGFLVLLIWFST